MRSKAGHKISIVHFNLGVSRGDMRCVAAFASALKKLGNEVLVSTPVFNPRPFGREWNGVSVSVVSSKESRSEKSANSIAGKIPLFIEPLHPEQIADKVTELMGDEKTCNKITSNAQKLVKENLGCDIYARRLVDMALTSESH